MLPDPIEYQSLTQLDEVARALLDQAGRCRVWLFEGEMGAGKTTLIKAICKRLGVVSPVQSPTFALVNEYVTETGNPIYHFDFYRIKSETEAFDMGVEEYFDSGDYCFVEWPSLIPSLWPPDRLMITLDVQPDGRRTIHLKTG